MKNFISVNNFIIMAIVIGINCNAEVLKTNGTAGKDLDAQTLVSYGREFNNSLIMMIGRVIENYHLCTAWSDWSKCGATLADHFSIRTRTRRCGGRGARSSYRDERETGVCEGRGGNKTKKTCPDSYHTTTKGFCLKLYMDKKSNPDAQAVCKNDGGFLVNIDSDQKYENVKAMLLANSVTSNLHIDGRYVKSQWKFSYGSTAGYFHWYPGYPHGLPSKACLMLTGNRKTTSQRFLTFNDVWSSVYPFICEILLNV